MFRPLLRSHRQKLGLLKTSEQTSYQLAHHYGSDDNRRAESLHCWDAAPQSPRLTQHGINIPLESREQTILSYEVSPAVRAIINGQCAPLIHSRSEAAAGEKTTDIPPDK